MKFIQEFYNENWKPLHRLVLVDDFGNRTESLYASYEDLAILSDQEISGLKPPEVVTSGWISATDFWDGSLPRVSRFEATTVTIEEATTLSGPAISEQVDELLEEPEPLRLVASGPPNRPFQLPQSTYTKIKPTDSDPI